MTVTARTNPFDGTTVYVEDVGGVEVASNQGDADAIAASLAAQHPSPGGSSLVRSFVDLGNYSLTETLADGAPFTLTALNLDPASSTLFPADGNALAPADDGTIVMPAGIYVVNEYVEVDWGSAPSNAVSCFATLVLSVPTDGTVAILGEKISTGQGSPDVGRVEFNTNTVGLQIEQDGNGTLTSLAPTGYFLVALSKDCTAIYNAVVIGDSTGQLTGVELTIQRIA